MWQEVFSQFASLDSKSSAQKLEGGIVYAKKHWNVYMLEEKKLGFFMCPIKNNRSRSEGKDAMFLVARSLKGVDIDTMHLKDCILYKMRL